MSDDRFSLCSLNADQVDQYAPIQSHILRPAPMTCIIVTNRKYWTSQVTNIVSYNEYSRLSDAQKGNIYIARTVVVVTQEP